MTSLTGSLTSGLNRGAKFLALPVYKSIFTKELKEEPFCGTLNLVISPEDAELVGRLFDSAHTFDNLVNEGKPVGAIATLPIRLSNGEHERFSVIVRPLLTSHQSEIIEIVSSICFREEWGLEDGDTLTVEFIE